MGLCWKFPQVGLCWIEAGGAWQMEIRATTHAFLEIVLSGQIACPLQQECNVLTLLKLSRQPVVAEE